MWIVSLSREVQGFSREKQGPLACTQNNFIERAEPVPCQGTVSYLNLNRQKGQGLGTASVVPLQSEDSGYLSWAARGAHLCGRKTISDPGWEVSAEQATMIGIWASPST